MNVTALSPAPYAARALSTPAPRAEEPPKDDFTIVQAAEGLAGAVLGGAIESVGCTGATILRLPQATYQSYKTLWNTPQIGPVLKTTVAMMLPVAVVATPLLAAVGGAGVGMVRGFIAGSEHGIGESIKTAGRDVKTLFKDGTNALLEGLREYETRPLEPGEKPYDIRIIEGARGLVGGAVGLVVDGVGIGVMGLLKTPKALFKTYKALFKSDLGPIQKTAIALLIPPLAALVVPLGLVAGAVYGMAMCAKEGYTTGVGAAAKESVQVLKDVHKWSHELLENLDK